jgi:enoyl-[acyl-carrier protein] reductase III
VVLCRADLTNDRGLEQLDQTLKAHAPQLSGLVHCAATGVHRPVEQLDWKHFDFTFNLNVAAFFKVIKLVLPRLAKGSSVVAISSWGGQRSLPSYAVVGASKGALESLARHLAVDLAPRGIRVNIIVAGAVLTEVWKALPDAESRLVETIRRTPAGRLVTAEEVACGAQFLFSDAASGIIGQSLVIDGGTGIMV